MSALCFSFIALSFCTFFFLSFYFVVCTLTTLFLFFFFSSRRRHTRYIGDWSSDVCSSDLGEHDAERIVHFLRPRLDGRIIIALGAQQLGQEVGVCARAAADLRGIGRILAFGFKRRLPAEIAKQDRKSVV